MIGEYFYINGALDIIEKYTSNHFFQKHLTLPDVIVQADGFALKRALSNNFWADAMRHYQFMFQYQTVRVCNK
jgi:hypothetical protein